MKRYIRCNSEALKETQLQLILNSNPVDGDVSVWIRDVDDILTFEEAMTEDELIDPDFTEEDVEECLRTGKVTVYSSKPIVNGNFVSPSKMEASAYSGDGYIYCANVKLTDVAWIDCTQGQVATNNSISSKRITADKM